MVTVIIQHDVQDFATWKQGFDQHQGARAAAGVKSHKVGQLAGAPNTVVLISDWESLDRFQAFIQSPGLAEAMKAGGVTSAPIVQIIERAEVATY
jgi:heme-degrading monooxygenase HmoA